MKRQLPGFAAGAILLWLAAAGCSAPTPQPTPTLSPTVTHTVVPSSTSTPTPFPTQTATPTPMPTATPLPSATPTTLLYVLPGTPLPAVLTPIAVDNAGQVSGLANWKEDTVTALGWAADRQTLAVATGNGIGLYDLQTRQRFRSLYPRGGGVIGLSFSADGNWLAASSLYGSEKEGYAGDIQLWYGSLLKPLGTIYAETRAISSLAFTPDSNLLAVAFSSTDPDQNTVEFFNTRSWEITRTMQTGAVLNIAIAPAGGILASEPDRYAIRLWRLKDGMLLDTLYTSFSGAVSSMAFNPAGNMLATGHYDGAIRLWDIGSGKAVVTMQTEGVVQSLAFSPDGSLLATGSSYQDSAVRLWNTADGALLRTLEGHTTGVEYLIFSPEGQYLVSASYDGSVRLWGNRP
jgi:WD40 repeat protein